MTPPRSKSSHSASCVLVLRYESAKRHCRPPPNHTPPASRMGWTNPSVSASSRSFVCRTVRLVAPAARNCRKPLQSWSYSSSPPAVGMTTISASGPPAKSRNLSRMASSLIAPPTITSDPFFGPTCCATAPSPNTTAMSTASPTIRRNIESSALSPGDHGCHGNPGRIPRPLTHPQLK